MSLKRKLTQDDLRKAMSEQKKKLGINKKIDSPLAKYPFYKSVNKVRNVEYKDPIEEEWEKFQKEIKEETAQSAQIIADDQEEATTERQLDEIEEQIRHWSRVIDLAKHMEQVQGTDRKQENIDDDVLSSDEAEFEEFLDWRAKNSYK
ncbi:zinc finger protein 830-like [Formica exsecta]|uniref:zinc finger protein 830-like n=1 Tax=Formica exsecta TaxID=72781 RepID=UPI0011442907|nr:zinc finger protein 830-like [Formica exsecta]